MWLPHSLRSLMPGLVLVFLGSTLATAQPSDDGMGGGADAVAERQSMDAFTSLEDGQPGAPGSFELRFDFGWSTSSGESDPAIWETEIKYTADGSDFLRNMKLSLTVPVELGNGAVEGNGDSEFAWQQRWVAESGDMPTLATILSLRAPTGYHSSGFDGTLTGIVAKDWGPGTFFLNGWITSANGDNVEDLRDIQWGGRVAYLWRCADDISVTADYVIQSSEMEGESNMNLFELGVQYHVTENLIIGPGVVVGLDGRESTPNFEAGIRITYSF